MINITLAISTEFFDSFAKLPKQIQRKVTAFINKFRNNPTSTGINYEKIINASDRNIFSVRIDDTYRGIIAKHEKEGTYILLWVDHHDEAYAWATKRRCCINPTTGNLQIYEVQEEPLNAVLDGECIFQNYSDEQLLKLSLPNELIPQIRTITSDNSFYNLKGILPDDAYENLEWLLNGFSYEDVENYILSNNHEQETPNTYADALKTAQAQRSFVVVDNDDDLIKMMSEPLEKWRVFLHPTQNNIVNKNYSGSARVLGSAGTGKTVVAMHRAKVLSKKCNEKEKVLFTTYTSNLAKDIYENLKKICNLSELNKIEVINLDAWASRYLKDRNINYTITFDETELCSIWDKAIIQSGENIDLPAKFFIDEWNNVICAQEAYSEGTYLRAQRIGRGIRLDRKMRMQLWKVFEEYQNIMKESNLRDPNWAYYECKIAILNDKFSKNYKYIIVDEGQDLSMSAYLLLRAISGEEHENDIFIVGDAKQRIYKNKAILSKAGINIRGRSSKLKINYRTTEEIRKYATLVLENLTFDDLDGEEDSKKECQSLTHGVEPSVNYFQTANQELEFIVTKIMQLKAEGTEYKNICLTARTQKLLDDYSKYLLQHNIPYYEIKRSKIDDRSVDGVRIATMHRIKGLEFRYMFVAAVNKDIIPFKESQKHFDDDVWYNEYVKSEKCLLYVALTRAQRAVFITSYGKLSDLIKAS